MRFNEMPAQLAITVRELRGDASFEGVLQPNYDQDCGVEETLVLR